LTATFENPGIGKGFVRHLLLRPNTIVVAGVRDPSSDEAIALTEFESAAGSKVILAQINSKSERDAKNAVQDLVSKHGIERLDIVIANAGIFDTAAHQKVLDMNLSDLQDHIEVNTYGVIRLFQATWSLLEKSSKPIFLLNSAGAATMGGMKPFSRFPLASYASSKLLANFFILRLHIEHPNLIAFAVHPGSVVTENRTAAAAKFGVPVEGLSVDECVTSLLSLVSDIYLSQRML
jgi:norsolorinic acid ketoreductase